MSDDLGLHNSTFDFSPVPPRRKIRFVYDAARTVQQRRNGRWVSIGQWARRDDSGWSTDVDGRRDQLYRAALWQANRLRVDGVLIGDVYADDALSGLANRLSVALDEQLVEPS